jgi:hypothetical protein
MISFRIVGTSRSNSIVLGDKTIVLEDQYTMNIKGIAVDCQLGYSKNRPARMREIDTIHTVNLDSSAPPFFNSGINVQAELGKG